MQSKLTRWVQCRVNVQTCDFNGLPDLNTSSPVVQSKHSQYIALLASLGITAFRLDSALLMSATDIQGFMGTANTSLVYQVYACDMRFGI